LGQRPALGSAVLERGSMNGPYDYDDFVAVHLMPAMGDA
jgi:hypothetical protein